MSTPHKPSQQENEYFAREDSDRRRRMAAGHPQPGPADTPAHIGPLGHCPRCGLSMQPVPHSVVHALACQGCRGMFLDAADLKAVDGKEGYLSHLLREMSSRSWR